MPMVHVTVFDLIDSDVGALISSCFVLFDVGMVTLNQYILLDPILLCFMTASVMGMVKVSKATHNRQTFTFKWWSWLLFTGTMIACTISVKFVGLFVILLVGLHTINDLWIELGDLTKPVVSILEGGEASLYVSLHEYGVAKWQNLYILLTENQTKFNLNSHATKYI